MQPDITVDIDLSGIVLCEASTGSSFDLGAGPPLTVLSIIRHRY